MTSPSHFKRIARDLEKLPCELHESVLVELEFSQLIRLSTSAGPKLQWSLENSLSSWGEFFKNARMAELQRLLAITDRVKALCFQLPTKKGEQPEVFQRGSLSFLQFRDSDWRPRPNRPNPELRDQVSVIHHWLGYLNIIVLNTTWDAFHENYPRLIKPWLDEAGDDVFRKVPEIGKNVSPVDQRTAFSIDDLSNFIDSYQRLRRKRAEGLANELRHLVIIYEAHPDRVKMPFAPQTQRSNKTHISNQMRWEAKILIRKAEFGRWKDKQTARYRFRFLFPALVPYDWTTQLFNDIWNGKSSTFAEDMIQRCKDITKRAPFGMLDTTSLTSPGVGQVLHATPLRKPVLEEQGSGSRAHPEEVNWLQAFAEVIAWMEETYPDKVRDVRGDDFWVRNSK